MRRVDNGVAGVQRTAQPRKLLARGRTLPESPEQSLRSVRDANL